LAKGIVGASNAIFMRRAIFKEYMFDKIDHRYPFSFDLLHKILLPFISMIYTNLINLKCLWVMVKITI